MACVPLKLLPIPAPHLYDMNRRLAEGAARIDRHHRYRQNDVPIDHALVQDLAHPVVHIGLGTTQAQRRFTAHRYQVFALATCF